MKDEFIIKRHGKDYVLYAGLLNEVHNRYDNWSIATEVIDSGEPVIVHARFRGSSDGGPTVCTDGTGTAPRADDRSGPAKNAPLEMAETRAKARALRDAVNVGATTLEELPDEDSLDDEDTSYISPGAARRAADPRYQRANVPRSEPSLENTEGQITDNTISELRLVARTYAETVGKDPEAHLQAFEEENGEIVDLSQGQGQRWIRRYTNALDKLENEGYEDVGQADPEERG